MLEGLLSLQDLFKNNIFKVPNYQRGYSWETVQRQDLLDDLEAMQEQKKHYTGTVVLKECDTVNAYGETYKRYDIVDGQQRITSLIIFLKRISDELNDIKNEESEKISKVITELYIQKEAPQGKVYKLELDENSNMFFKEIILNDKSTIEPEIVSHRRLMDAGENFKTYLNQKKETEKDYLGYLKTLITKLTQNLTFTQYKVEDDAEVGVIFEVMNDRGKPLSQLDKVKNHVLYLNDKISEDKHAKQELTNKINYAWRDILQNLSSAGKTETSDEDQFLRINYVINFYTELASSTDPQGKKVSINTQLADAHKLVKKKFKQGPEDNAKLYNEIGSYVDSLMGMSRKLRDVMQPFDASAFEDITDENIRNEIRTACDQLKRLERERTVLPFLLSITIALKKDPEKLLELLKMWEILIFRIFSIGSMRPHTAESMIFKLSCDIYNSRVNYEQTKNEIRSIVQSYVADNDIEKFLASKTTDYYDWSGLKYFLYEYERFRCKEETRKRPIFEWDDLKKRDREDSIEHILPKAIRKYDGSCEVRYWCDRFDEESHRTNKKRLGNLTLTTRNSDLSNKPLDEKRKIYEKSGWQIERDVSEFMDWTTKQIDEREAKLVLFAKERWSV